MKNRQKLRKEIILFSFFLRQGEGVLVKNADYSIGLFLAPIVFVFLWSGGFAAAKVGIKYAEPMTLLVWRYI